MTASSRINLQTDLNRFDETRGNVTVTEKSLLVNEKNIDRQTHTHHTLTGGNAPKETPESLSGTFQLSLNPDSQNIIRHLLRETT